MVSVPIFPIFPMSPAALPPPLPGRVRETGFHGLRCVRLWRTALHPWLQPGAPYGAMKSHCLTEPLRASLSPQRGRQTQTTPKPPDNHLVCV